MSVHDTFKTNFKNSKVRQDFTIATGLDATKEPAAFIAYLNNLAINAVAVHVAHMEAENRQLVQRVQRLCRHLKVDD